jgi:hypothetical protein
MELFDRRRVPCHTVNTNTCQLQKKEITVIAVSTDVEEFSHSWKI